MRKPSRVLVLAILSIAILLLAAGSSLAVSRLEERDTFCIACHTLPEAAYHERAVQYAGAAQTAPDLSTRHYQLEEGAFRCIDCHRGEDTLRHRLLAQSLSARDTLKWILGRADPALEKGTVTVPLLVDAACVRCHAETLSRRGFENHFHAYLPEARELGMQSSAEAPSGDMGREAERNTTVSCTACHTAHVQVPGAELAGYLDLIGKVYPACETCHLETGSGPQQLSGTVR
jgi:nitrate/TMAO reductase-like tetraheme cytochrome c subunit